jgi:beta-lactamase regulating signal transducer with metallopeptidase domain
MNTTDFIKRAKGKKKSAIWMLCVGVAIIVGGLFIFSNQLSIVNENYTKSLESIAASVKDSAEREKLLHSLDTNQLLNMVSRIGLLVIVFFLAQIFLKLYKYHLNMSDFYLSCCDSIDTNNEIKDTNKIKTFVLLLRTFYPSHNRLEIPNDIGVDTIIDSLKK